MVWLTVNFGRLLLEGDYYIFTQAGMKDPNGLRING